MAHSSERQSDEVVDSSNMRVEEKIARGYHRDLSWRKVLVKLEPDAHNNIFVRRMFVNAYGWPVVKHIVDSHFSDSAIARGRDEDEYVGERALDMGQPPDEHGAETRTTPPGRILVSSPPTASPEQRTQSEAREALDDVPSLPSLLEPTGTAAAVPDEHQQQQLRPSMASAVDRYDSAAWSDRDWQDSGDESDADERASSRPGSGAGKAAGQEKDGGGSGGEWSWTEKIVGKGEGATRK